MADTEGTPLTGVSGWTQDFINKLNEGWITSIEQVVSLARTPHGIHALGEYLSIDEPHAHRLVDAARARLGLAGLVAPGMPAPAAASARVTVPSEES